MGDDLSMSTGLSLHPGCATWAPKGGQPSWVQSPRRPNINAYGVVPIKPARDPTEMKGCNQKHEKIWTPQEKMFHSSWAGGPRYDPSRHD
eukprot:SAG22_NODE_392_length_11210_cov_3.879669_5_plen_90_part_00